MQSFFYIVDKSVQQFKQEYFNIKQKYFFLKST